LLEGLGSHWLTYDLLEAGEVSAAAQAQARVRAIGDDFGDPLFRHSALVWNRVLEQLEGRFDRAGQLAHEAMNLSPGAQSEHAMTHFLGQQLAVVGDQGGEKKLLATMKQASRDGGTLWSAAIWLLEVYCADLVAPPPTGGPLAAIRLPELPRDVYWLTTLAWVAEASASTGDIERSAVLYELLAPYADRWVQFIFNGSFGCLHRHLGLLASQLGWPGVASEHFEEAVARHEIAGAVALEARTRCDYGEALFEHRAAGSVAQAIAMCERARRLAQTCGAQRITERLSRIAPVAALSP
jgi:hypothetical protein